MLIALGALVASVASAQTGGESPPEPAPPEGEEAPAEGEAEPDEEELGGDDEDGGDENWGEDEDEDEDLEGNDDGDDDLEGDDEDWDDEEDLEGEDAEPEPPPAGDPYAPQTQRPRVPRTLCHGRMIRRIRVEGARRVDPEDVRATMRLRRGLPCTDDEVARDARALWEMGFFDDLVIEAERVGNEVEMIVRVRERPAIGRIVFDGNDEVEDEDIDEKITLREGAILSVPDVRRQVTKIRDLYAEEGFFLARVEYEIRRIQNDNNEIEVRFSIEEGAEVSVRRIRFVGNRNIPADDLNAIMQTSEEGFFSFISDDDHYDSDAFDDDVTRLQAWYYDQGYLAMSVGVPRIELTADREHIDITIPIDEGPRFRVGRLRVREVNADGAEVEPLESDLRDAIDLESGDWFSRTQIALGLQEITRTYRDEGYARVEVGPETNLDSERRIVDITVSIVRGPPVRIERINIRGNTKTRDSVIRREMLILEGELYDQTLVERSKRRIEALGYFERTDLSEETGSAPDRMVINVEVQERATGTFQVGAGFSSIEQFILTAQIQQQNLFGNGQSLSLQLQLSGIRQLVQLRFFEPWFLGTQWGLGVDVFKTIRQFADFNRDSTGGGLTLGHPIFDRRLRVALQYRAELVRISARTGGFFQSGGGGAGFNIFRRVPLDNLFRSGLTSSLRLTFTWDNRNNRLFPSDGWFASYSAEVADRFLGSDQVFFRQTAFVRHYRQIFSLGAERPVIFKVNAEFGLINSRQNRGVPIFECFFLGGIFNVRGFPLNSLGPRVSIPRSTDPNAVPPRAGNGIAEGVAIGGNLQLFYQAELEVPIVPSVGIRAVLFTDGGNVWNLENALCQGPETTTGDRSTDPCGFDIRGIRNSWGFGFRWFSPLGPLRFEWGIPINRKPWEDKIRFEFTIGNSF
ncbi:MAG TPA: outer membrane protein assembly factor BamA [Polyangiaceae bacterium LLY-WYZ-15_(1-7)]|nr:outer membrane protein assembly factor BamA [Polyangiaceae bacterium LLY-WYZ-15_(1-7)]